MSKGEFTSVELVKLRKILPTLKGRPILDVFQSHLDNLRKPEELLVVEKKHIDDKIEDMAVRCSNIQKLLNPVQETTEGDTSQIEKIIMPSIEKSTEKKFSFTASGKFLGKKDINNEPQGNFVFKKKRIQSSANLEPLIKEKTAHSIFSTSVKAHVDPQTGRSTTELKITKVDTRLMVYETIINPHSLKRPQTMTNLKKRGLEPNDFGDYRASSSTIVRHIRKKESDDHLDMFPRKFYIGGDLSSREKPKSFGAAFAPINLKPKITLEFLEKPKVLLVDGDYLRLYNSNRYENSGSDINGWQSKDKHATPFL